MKIIMMGFVFSTLAIASGGEMFFKDVTWNHHETFDVFEVEGIKMDAVERALHKCKSAGYLLCSLKNVKLTEHNIYRWSEDHNANRSFTGAEAVVKPLDYKDLIAGEVFTESREMLKDTDISDLDTLGIKHMALGKALNACYIANNDYCTILGSKLVEVNKSYFDKHYKMYRKRTSVEVSVRGYKENN